jgi:hypothetical protein
LKIASHSDDILSCFLGGPGSLPIPNWTLPGSTAVARSNLSPNKIR